MYLQELNIPLGNGDVKAHRFLLQLSIDDPVMLMPCFFSFFIAVTDLHVRCGRNAAMLDFTSVKRCAAVYLHTGKDHS